MYLSEDSRQYDPEWEGGSWFESVMVTDFYKRESRTAEAKAAVPKVRMLARVKFQNPTPPALLIYDLRRNEEPSLNLLLLS